ETGSGSAQRSQPKDLPKAKKKGPGSKGGKAAVAGSQEEQEEQSEKQAQQKREAIAALRRRHRIHVSPGTPDPVESFETMESRGIPPWLVRNLTSLGFSQPTPIQMQCFPAIMSGSHVLASAPTGSGKTIAFLGPILALLAKPGKEFARALVVDPSRELAKQTLDEFAKLTAGRKWNGRLVDKLSGDKAGNIKRLDVAVATPLRLVSLLRENRISLDSLKHLVFDEADKLLDLGFAPQMDELLTFCPKDKGRLMQTMMFSATLPPVVVDLAGSILTSPLRISIGDVNAAAPDVEQKLLFITSEDGKLFSLRQLLQDGEIKPPALVFVQSKERAKELFGELVYDGIFVDAIHADRTKLQRDNTVKAFRAGKLWVLICTDLMARGVDFKGVETVINYDFPQSAATYIHRIGRTGRAGRNGKAITLFTIEDFESLRSIVGVMRQSGCEVPDWMLRLKAKPKKERRMAEWRQPKRKRISTVSGYDKKKAHKKQQMVEASKKRKKDNKDNEVRVEKVRKLRLAKSQVRDYWPHIVRTKFDLEPSESPELVSRLRFCCTSCGEAVTLTACGRVHMSTLWRPFDVRLSLESKSGTPAGSRGAAFARVILCPSMLCNPTAGLLTLELFPAYPGGPGVMELLDSQSEEQIGDPALALHDRPAGLRLLLDTEGSPALILDGKFQDLASGRRQQQLCVEVSSQDATQNVLLEIQALSGARTLLVSICLAALGPLGDVPVLAYHLHFGSRCSLSLIASFEPRRHQVALRDAEAPTSLRPPLTVESKTLSKATEKEQQRQRLAQDLRQLPRPRAFVPSPGRPRAATAKLEALQKDDLQPGIVTPLVSKAALDLRLAFAPHSDAGNAAMSAVERGSNWQLALSMVFQANYVVITALGRSSQWQAALQLLQEFESNEIEPGAITFNAAISACGAQAQVARTPGRWQKTLQVFGGMCDWGPKPDIAACGSLMDAFARAGLWVFALWLLSCMSCTESPLPKPDMAAYTAAMSACAASFQWEQATLCLRDMRARLVRVSAAAYNAASLACERAVQVQPLLHLMKDMHEETLQADSITYLALTSALGKGQQWERALAEFGSLHCKAVRPSSNLVNSAITACEKGYAWLSAMSVFGELRNFRILPTVVSSSATITAAAAQQEWLPAICLLEDMVDWQVQADTIAWNSMLDACELSSQWTLACDLLAEMNWGSGSDDVGIVALLAASGASENAEQPKALMALMGQLRSQCRKELQDATGKQRQQKYSVGEAEPSSMSHMLEAHELLVVHGAAASDLQVGTALAVLRPCLVSLQSLCGLGAKRMLPAAGSQLWEPVLERQFSLGDVFTRLALHRVSMDSLLGHHWFGAAAYESRKVLRQPAQLSQDHDSILAGASGQDPSLLQKTPSAEGLAGWLAATTPNNQSASSRGQVLGYGGGEQGPLRPVFVQHDRSRHAERLALSQLIAWWMGAPM
ncbi:ddx52, partial [Symbiodinium pilosum]